MTAPDSFLPSGGQAGAHATGTLRIRLDEALDPSHLALIAVRDWALCAPHDLSVVLDVGGAPGSGPVALQEGACDLLLVRPLSLLERPTPGCEVIACLFETRGGVLVREDRLGKLRAGELLRVAASQSGKASDRLCRRILQGWAGRQGFAVAQTLIAVDPVPAAGLSGVAALLVEADAVWPAHANAEDVVARLQGPPARLITAGDADLPSFAALGLMARERRSRAETARHAALLDGLQEAARRLASDPAAAARLWSAATGDESPTAAAVVAATVPLLTPRPDRRPDLWRSFESLMEDA